MAGRDKDKVRKLQGLICGPLWSAAFSAVGHLVMRKGVPNRSKNDHQHQPQRRTPAMWFLGTAIRATPHHSGETSWPEQALPLRIRTVSRQTKWLYTREFLPCQPRNCVWVCDRTCVFCGLAGFTSYYWKAASGLREPFNFFFLFKRSFINYTLNHYISLTSSAKSTFSVIPEYPESSLREKELGLNSD